MVSMTNDFFCPHPPSAHKNKLPSDFFLKKTFKVVHLSLSDFLQTCANCNLEPTKDNYIGQQ
jgi:hypothetical protein